MCHLSAGGGVITIFSEPLVKEIHQVQVAGGWWHIRGVTEGAKSGTVFHFCKSLRRFTENSCILLSAPTSIWCNITHCVASAKLPCALIREYCKIVI